MRRCFFTSSILLALLVGCNSTEPVQPKPTVIVRHIEPREPDDPNYVAPKGMTRVEVYDMLEERAGATREALDARERQRRPEPWRRRSRLNIYLGDPLYRPYGYHRPYYYGHCWPWHRHHGIHLRNW